MNQQTSKNLILKILAHYSRLGAFKFVPHDVEEYTRSPACEIIEAENYQLLNEVPDYYHNSITTAASVASSIDGTILQLQALPVPGLYWIRKSQGFDNAPIIAHIHSYEGKGEKLFAVVAAQ